MKKLLLLLTIAAALYFVLKERQKRMAPDQSEATPPPQKTKIVEQKTRTQKKDKVVSKPLSQKAERTESKELEQESGEMFSRLAKLQQECEIGLRESDLYGLSGLEAMKTYLKNFRSYREGFFKIRDKAISNNFQDYIDFRYKGFSALESEDSQCSSEALRKKVRGLFQDPEVALKDQVKLLLSDSIEIFDSTEVIQVMSFLALRARQEENREIEEFLVREGDVYGNLIKKYRDLFFLKTDELEQNPEKYQKSYQEFFRERDKFIESVKGSSRAQISS